MNSDQYDSNISDFNSPINLGNPPDLDEIPLSAYDSFDANNLGPEDINDLSLQEALGKLTPSQALEAPPEYFATPIFNEDDHEQTPVSRFLVDQINRVDLDAKAKNPNAPDIDLQTAFPKNTQTQWFAEFNQSALNGDQPGLKLISKANGFFYKGDEDPRDALEKLGVAPNLLDEFAPHFEMSYFGNTRSRTKNNGNENGFKSYVMHLKDPKNPRSLEILNDVIQAKQNTVQTKLDKSYDLAKAVEAMAARADSIIAAETKKTGVTPFVGSTNRLFLSPSALYAEINEKAPELKGLYAIEPLDIKGNKITYSGYSEGLESYFEDDLKICKLTTKNPDKLPQEELERIVSEKLELNLSKDHVASTPSDALIQQIEELANESDLADPTPKANPSKKPEVQKESNSNSFVGDSQQKNKNKKQDYSNDDQSHFNRRKRAENAEQEEQSSLAKVALDAFSKVTQATLAAAIALATLILQTIMALLKALARMVGMNVGSESLLPANPLLTYNNALDRMRMTKGPAEDTENTKDLDPKNALTDLTKALDADIENTADLSNEYKLSEVEPLDKLKLSQDALNNLSIEDRARLDEKASSLFQNLTDEDRQDYLKKINIEAEHSFADDLESKLSEPLVYDDRFGVLLATSDKVEFNGNEYGVVSAAVVGGTLLYAVAKETPDGNYDIQFAKANELTLKEHNAFNFDNFNNLNNHINEQLVKNFPEHEGKIEKLAIVNRQDLKGHEISIAELNNRTNFIKFNQLGFDTSSISVDDLIKDNPVLNNDLYQSLPQLHQDKTGAIASHTKENMHPFFGRLLDINDQVDGKIPNSDITIRGSVVGAYESDADLYYQIMHGNEFYSIKAEDVILTTPNGGDLTNDQINLLNSNSQEGKDFRIGIL